VGGGCWNNNNRDDQPGDPHEVITTFGEGPDCSGPVFKTWELANDSSGADRGFYRRAAPRHQGGAIDRGSLPWHQSARGRAIPGARR
jgi:hypothetical protein